MAAIASDRRWGSNNTGDCIECHRGRVNSDQLNFVLPVVCKTWKAAESCNLAEKFLTSGDA